MTQVTNQNSGTEMEIFENFTIRKHYDQEKETWYFSVIDIVAALTNQKDFKKAQSYWTTLKSRLKREGSESVTKCDKLKLLSADGKFYKAERTLPQRDACGMPLRAVEPPYYTGEIAYFGGESPCFTGETASFSGESPCFTGETASFGGESPYFTGEIACLIGESPCFTGEIACLVGESPCFTGEVTCLVFPRAYFAFPPQRDPPMPPRHRRGWGGFPPKAHTARHPFPKGIPSGWDRTPSESPSDWEGHFFKFKQGVAFCVFYGSKGLKIR